MTTADDIRCQTCKYEALGVRDYPCSACKLGDGFNNAELQYAARYGTGPVAEALLALDVVREFLIRLIGEREK